MFPPRWRIAVLSLLFLTACSQKPAPPAYVVDSGVAYLANGWSAAERAEYYHLMEGSELMPYALVANLKSSKTGKPFLEDMERFGFLPDAKSATNPYGLPVGMTVGPSRNASSLGIRMVGFSCAACHVGQLTYKGKLVQVDGSPAMIDLQSYQVEFQQSLDAVLKDPPALLTLILAMERDQNPQTPGTYAVTVGPPWKDAVTVTAAPNADPGFHSVSSQAADAAQPSPPSDPAARLKTDLAFLKARISHILNGKLLLDGTEPGPGRIDAFGAARNLLFPKSPIKMQSPVSFPFLWNVPDTTQQQTGNQEARWIHYDGNTNSILERNIGQALGMGAVFDPATYESTIRIGNLHRLEVLTHKLQNPVWPADILGAIDPAKAQKGEAIFNQKCAGCHQDKLIPLTEVSTDPMRANSFGQPVGTIPFPAAASPILEGLKKRAFQDDGISAADQVGMDANPAIWRATGQYMARKLNGIWATGPYLHNGSVPTLYHLLHPEQRPARFLAGNREYDPVKVGFQSESANTSVNVWAFDTTKTGNSNIGHTGEQFGTALAEDDKAALLEYLKKY